MLKKIIASLLVLTTVGGISLAATGAAEARNWRYGHGYGYGYGHRGGWGYNNGGAIAGGVAAGLLGGVLLGGAIANSNNGSGYYPGYYDNGYYGGGGPVYAPRCYFQNQRVPNQYNPGWHVERVRVCD